MTVIPIFRMFDVAKAREFYLDYLGWCCDWAHDADGTLPLYMQVSRDGCCIHLSEHVGDATPGSHVRIAWPAVFDYHRELQAKRYRYLNPGVERMPWGSDELQVTDPFGNRITFHTAVPAAPA